MDDSMENPAYNNDDEILLFGNRLRKPSWKICNAQTYCFKISVAVGTSLSVALIIALIVVTVPKASPVSPTQPTTTVNPIPSSTTTKPSSTTTTKATTPLTTATSTTAATTTTTSKTTTHSTTTASTTTTTELTTTTKGPNTTDTPLFPPPTKKPFPANATDYPPVSLLIDMGMNPNFTEVKCFVRPQFQPFKYNVTVAGHVFTSLGADRKHIAKTGAAMVANEAIFGIKYKSIPTPSHYNCTD